MTRDKIQQLARDAGGIKAVEYADPQCFIGNMSFTDQELSVFAGLVLEEAAKVCESRWGSVSMFAHSRDAKANNEAVESCARAIRAMKPKD
jgi:hypothetical protein